MTNLLALSLLLTGTHAPAAKTFEVVGGLLGYRNLATVENESEFETFTGKTNNVSGSLSFDPAKHTGSGTLTVDVASIDTGIPLRNEHMQSAGWLDAKKYPTIVFKATKSKYLGKDTYTVTGALTLHGVTKTITGSAKLKYRAAGAETKQAGFDGDVVQVTAKLPIKIGDYGIAIPANAKGKVSNLVTIGVSAYAVAK